MRDIIFYIFHMYNCKHYKYIKYSRTIITNHLTIFTTSCVRFWKDRKH